MSLSLDGYESVSSDDGAPEPFEPCLTPEGELAIPIEAPSDDADWLRPGDDTPGYASLASDEEFAPAQLEMHDTNELVPIPTVAPHSRFQRQVCSNRDLHVRVSDFAGAKSKNSHVKPTVVQN